MAEDHPVTCPFCVSLDLDWPESVLIHTEADLAGVSLEVTP